MRTPAILIFITLCMARQVAGTPREPDRLMYDGEQHFVHQFRVSEAMWKNYWDYRMRRGVDKGDLSGSTSRGIRFVADLAILDGKLFLVKARVGVYNEAKGYHDEEVPLAELFGTKPANDGIFASWFSGELREYYGEEVGYSELTDRAKVYRFEKGVFKGIGDIAVPEAVELRERLGLPKKKPAANQ